MVLIVLFLCVGAELPGLTDYIIAPFMHIIPLCVDLSGHKSGDYFPTELPELCDYRNTMNNDPVVKKVVVPYDLYLQQIKDYRKKFDKL